MLLEHVKNISGEDEELEKDFLILNERIDSIRRGTGMTDPDSDIPMPRPGTADDEIRSQDYPDEVDVESTMAVVIKQMEAARKAMAMLNKMADSPFRTKHKSRVMGNLNRIRGSLNRVEKMMDQE